MIGVGSIGGGIGSLIACDSKGSECVMMKGGGLTVAAVAGGDSFVTFSSMDWRGERVATPTPLPAPYEVVLEKEDMGLYDVREGDEAAVLGAA